MSRQRKRHPDTVNAGKMYTSERKASFKVKCFSNNNRWRAVSRLLRWSPKRLYWRSFISWLCPNYPEAADYELKYLRGRK